MRKQKKNSRNYGMTGEDRDGKDKKADHDQITIVKVEQIGHAELEDIPITDLRTYL